MSGIFLATLLMLSLWHPTPTRAAGEEAGLAWCYRTLADVVCYTAPDPGRENRFVGAYPSRPDAARRRLLEEGRRRAAALAPKYWPPGAPERPSPAPSGDGVRTEPPPAAAPVAAAMARSGPPPVPVMRPLRGNEQPAAGIESKPPAEAVPRPPDVECAAPRIAGPRPLTGPGHAGCGAEAD